MEVDNSKPLDQKNIIERFTVEGQFKIGSALLYQEQVIKKQEERILGLEEAMQFFSEWYNKTQRVDILVPDSLKNEIDGKTKLIL
jgi:beta-lactamase class D